MNTKPIWIFLGKFILIAPIVWVIWWSILPGYAWFIGQVSGSALIYVGGQSIEAMRIVRGEDALLNADTSIVYIVNGAEYPFHVALLVANLPPLLILVAATPGMRLRRALRTMLIGAPIIILGQIGFIFAAFLLRNEIAASPEIPKALGYVLLTLPFALWILLVQLFPGNTPEAPPTNGGRGTPKRSARDS